MCHMETRYQKESVKHKLSLHILILYTILKISTYMLLQCHLIKFLCLIEYFWSIWLLHILQAIASNIEPRKQRTKSSIPATRLSKSSPLSTRAGINQATLISAHTKTADPPQISGVTSCHSTVTSDSSASSPAGTRKDQPSQGGTSPISRKKEPKKEKLTSLRKHKLPEDNQLHKGKTFDGKQKTRTGRSTYASFNSSSRAGHMAVGVASWVSSITTRRHTDADSCQPQHHLAFSLFHVVILKKSVKGIYYSLRQINLSAFA